MNNLYEFEKYNNLYTQYIYDKAMLMLSLLPQGYCDYVDFNQHIEIGDFIQIIIDEGRYRESFYVYSGYIVDIKYNHIIYANWGVESLHFYNEYVLFVKNNDLSVIKCVNFNEDDILVRINKNSIINGINICNELKEKRIKTYVKVIRMIIKKITNNNIIFNT